ncbi:MAG: S8 family serine peptidase, partial [Alistipes sp.]|nr:S8 family serine peptidase [Alistipes sp.]
MFTKKSILFAALWFAACSSDPLSEMPGTSEGGTADGREQKIVNTASHAVAGSLLVYFDDRAVEQLESATAAAAVTRSAATRSGIDSVDEIFDGLQVRSLRRVFPCNPKSEERTRAAGLHKWYLVEFDETADLDAAARRIASVAEVQHVQFNSAMKRADDFRAQPLRSTAPTAAAQGTFNDPQLGRQWHYNNTGNKSIAQTARAGADINVVDAWRLTAGDPRIIVAVVDEGVKYNHPDLADNMWINPDPDPEMQDIHGYNFVTRGPVTWDKHHPTDSKKDDTGHGTHVAGTVAAVNNNSTGVCGVAGGTGSGDGVRIMSCQIFSGDSNSSGSTAATAEAIKYAADHGAAILQCSFGYEAGLITSDSQYARSQAVEKQAIDYFIATRNCEAVDGGIVIFAAGNDAKNMAAYPGAYRDYISVTAFSPDFLPAYYTNYGPGCNVAAPGGDYKIAADQESSEVLSTLPSELYGGSDYGFMQGTSMACPHASGVAALGLAYALQLGKSFTREEFNTMLLTSVNDIDNYLEGTKNSINLEQYYKKMGTCAIEAYQLLMQVEGTPCLRAKVGSRQLLA